MIPAEAVEAARVAAFERYGTKPDAAYIRTLLTAAAPHMMAAAWNEGYKAGELDGAFQLNDHEPPDERNPYRPTE